MAISYPMSLLNGEPEQTHRWISHPKQMTEQNMARFPLISREDELS